MTAILWKKNPNILAKNQNLNNVQQKKVNILMKHSKAGTQKLKIRCLMLQFILYSTSH